MPIKLDPETARRLGAAAGGKPGPSARRSKYRNVRTEYNGRVYDSKAEAARARELDEMVKEWIVLWWLPQPTFRLGCHENVYRPDFVVVQPIGLAFPGTEKVRIHAEDVKGTETPKFRRDRRLWKRYGPFPLWIIKGDNIEIVEPEINAT